MAGNLEQHAALGGSAPKSADRFSTGLTEDGRYRLLVDSVLDYAIYMLSPEGIVQSWNRGAQRFKGYRPEEIIGRHFSTFYPEEDRAAGLPARALETARSTGSFESEGWRVRKDGTRFWAHVVIDAIRNDAGELVGFAKITRDLTERKKSQDALRESEERFRLLVQGVTDYAIYMIDRDGHVTNWNAGAQRIKGYTPEEIVGQHFSRFYTEEDRANGEPAKALQAAITLGRFEKEGWRQRKDGTRFWANVVIDPIRNPAGEIIGFAKVTRDITERKQTQRELELAREALFQSQKMEALGQLTGGIAHDFNNLLMAILGSLDLVRRRMAPDPRVTPFIENAILGAQRGAALTKRLLSFARRQDLKPEVVKIPTLVHGMSGLLQRSLGPSVIIESRFPLDLLPARADSNQLESALLNLAVNARDAMPDGGRILVSARNETVAPTDELGTDRNLKPGRYVCLTITDEGEGMDETTLARATEPFFTTKGVGKGTGLGLPMVLGLAEQSGGRFILKSRLGVGTTAELWLPVAEEADAAAQAPAVPGDQAVATTRKLAVLAVDDDGLVLMNTAAMLEELGHTVLKAHSGRQAMAIVDSEAPIDLVITDQAMPQMSGVQLAEAIHAARPGLPIVLASGYAELPAGVETSLPRLAKPYDQSELAEILGRLFP